MFLARREGKTCLVCRVPARYQNFGVTTCEACKAFFRRANQGDAYKSYRCASTGNCTIDAVARKNCSYCRYKRCINTGMSMAKSRKYSQEENDLQVTQQKGTQVTYEDQLDLAAKELFQELLTLTHCTEPVIDDKGKFFSMMELFDLESLSSRYAHSFNNIPIAGKITKDTQMSVEKYVGVLSSVIRRLIFFANTITEFKELCVSDRQTLFKGACSEVCMINAVIALDQIKGLWLVPMTSTSRLYQNFPGVESLILEEIMGADVYGAKLELTIDMQRYHPDETVIMLLHAILLFTPTRPNLFNIKAVQKTQIRFALLLRKYLQWRCGAKDGEDIFVALTKILKGFRKISPMVYETVHGPILEHPSFNLLINCFL